MIPISIFLFLAVVAGALALYSFLERQSWMYSQITAAGLSSTILWVLSAMIATGNVAETVYLNIGETVTNGTLSKVMNPLFPLLNDILPAKNTQITMSYQMLDPTLAYLFALFAIIMTMYFILHVANWVQDRIMNREEEEE